MKPSSKIQNEKLCSPSPEDIQPRIQIRAHDAATGIQPAMKGRSQAKQGLERENISNQKDIKISKPPTIHEQAKTCFIFMLKEDQPPWKVNRSKETNCHLHA
ncbi:hypothetical protein Droror1_Dr00016947 [Drosera rotundifolia]